MNSALRPTGEGRLLLIHVRAIPNENSRQRFWRIRLSWESDTVEKYREMFYNGTAEILEHFWQETEASRHNISVSDKTHLLKHLRQEGAEKRRMELSGEVGRPVIGVLGNLYTHGHSAYAAQMTYANSAYLNAVRENGGIPFVIPAVGTEEELDRLLSFCDGLLFPGGEDVDPKLFGEEPHPSIGSVNEQMDRFWILAEKKAEELRLPVLGICRGMQLINVARGGSLWQDISLFRADHQLHAQKQERSYPIHQVRIEEGSRLSKILGEAAVYTNTLHHQCVRIPGRDLAVTAWAIDGVAEAMESPEGRIVLVQWHPEELTGSVPKMNRLFSDLVQKAQKRRNGRQEQQGS